MRSGHFNIKYRYTAEECAEKITNSPAFSHVTKEQILEYLIIKDGFGRDIYTYIDKYGTEQEAGNYRYVSTDKKTTYFNIEWLSKRLIDDMGCTCRVCKALHHDSGYEVNQRVGVRVTNFLRDEKEFYYPVLCLGCAQSAASTIFGTHKNAILGNTDKATDEEIQLAVCAWMAQVVQREINKQPKKEISREG